MMRKSFLTSLKKAYDDTVSRHNQGIDEEALLPEAFTQSARYKQYQAGNESRTTHSDHPAIKRYLSPQAGMHFLDIGSNANLITRAVANWPSLYHGIDISPELVRVSCNYAAKQGIPIGGIYEAEAAHIPFEDACFDIAAAIGVFEYFDLSYCQQALKEVHRVLKPAGRLVIDIPNMDHPDTATMIEVEGYLGRKVQFTFGADAFEKELAQFFEIEKVDHRQLMSTFFVRK